MNSIVPLDAYDPELRQGIHQKLSALQEYEKEIPAVFIVHELPHFAVVYMSERGRKILGVSLDEIRMSGPEYVSRYFNPEDAATYVPKLQQLLERNQNDEMISYFQQVRSTPEEDWTWYLSSTKIFFRDQNAQPLFTLTMAVPIEAQSHITTKVERLMHENNFLHQKKEVFGSLTRREKEILKMMALGLHSGEIAVNLHISDATAATHRRNIKAKLRAQTHYDLVRFAQAFDLI